MEKELAPSGKCPRKDSSEEVTFQANPERRERDRQDKGWRRKGTSSRTGGSGIGKIWARSRKKKEPAFLGCREQTRGR